MSNFNFTKNMGKGVLALALIFGFSLSLTSYAQDSKSNRVHVYSMDDLPAPGGDGEIKLNPFNVYVFHGMINIGSNFINMNGAGLKGIDPGKDGVVSEVSGAVIRSNKNMVYMENFVVMLGSNGSQGYDFSDPSGKKYCNIFSGCSVLDAPGVTSKGVGKITGFNTTCIDLNYWNTADGLKVGGDMDKFTSALNYVTGIKKGAAFEILDGATINDIVATGNYFIYKGGIGIKVNPSAQIDQARFSLNLFRGQDKFLEGVDSFTPGWQMFGNGVGIPDTQAKAYFYMTGNSNATNFPDQSSFQKIAGNTNTKVEQKFKAEGNNKFVYTGKQVVNVDITADVRGISSNFKGSYTLVVMKNGVEKIEPNSTVSNIPQGQGFSLSLTTQTNMTSGDFLELYIKSNNNPDLKPLIITEMIFKIEE